MKEIFKTIDGFENYQVSNFGRVKSLFNNIYRKPVGSNGGYLQVGLCSNKRIYKCLIHRLVANAFIPNPNNLPVVNHIDGNKQNNNVSNLEWVTSQENSIHAAKIGLIGMPNNTHPVTLQNKETGEIYKFKSIKKCIQFLKIGTASFYDFRYHKYKNSKLNQKYKII